MLKLVQSEKNIEYLKEKYQFEWDSDNIFFTPLWAVSFDKNYNLYVLDKVTPDETFAIAEFIADLINKKMLEFHPEVKEFKKLGYHLTTDEKVLKVYEKIESEFDDPTTITINAVTQTIEVTKDVLSFKEIKAIAKQIKLFEED